MEDAKKHKSPKTGPNLLCRVANATPEKVCEYVHKLPKEPMTYEAFRAFMGKNWFQNIHQAPEQWGLYCLTKDGYIPKFKRDISIKEAEDYLRIWIRNFPLINPYSSFNKTCDLPMVDSIVEHLKRNPDEHDLKKIISELINFNEPFVLNEIIVNAINNFSGKLITKTIDKENESFEVYLNDNYVETNIKMDKTAFFQLFTPIEDAKTSPINDPLQIIYYGAPGTGKSNKIDNNHNVTDDNTIRTTFHPDTDYSTFVGAYKPSIEDNDITFITSDGKIKYAKPEDDGGKKHSGIEKKIVYKYIPQAFLKAYIKAWKNIDRPFFLVIEEINRGNCAQIFGDLFQLLDRNAEGFSTYAIDADEDIRKFIAEPSDKELSLKNIEIQDVVKPNGKLIASGEDIKNGKKLVLPNNLYIWATMNTSDQSLFPIDSAFKRRWEWKYTPISEGIDSISGEKLNWMIDFSDNNVDKDKQINWWQFIRSINELVETTTGSEDKKLGYFFCKAGSDGKISSDTFLSKVIFYLWNDVFRDYGFNSDVFKLLSDKAIKFHQFYNPDGTPNKDLLMNFAKKVIATYDPIKKEEKTVNETTD